MNNAELINELRYCFATHRTAIPLYVLLELEARLPKEGEWIECEDIESAMKGKVVCSNCKEPQCSIEMTPGAIRLKNEKTKYCPNCGARMKGEQE